VEWSGGAEWSPVSTTRHSLSSQQEDDLQDAATSSPTTSSSTMARLFEVNMRMMTVPGIDRGGVVAATSKLEIVLAAPGCTDAVAGG
jgi:hypothetical protein